MRVYELFTSIEGEITRWGQGALTTFIRLQGCNLRCSYCDTVKTQNPDGQAMDMTVSEALNMIKSHGLQRATITGGEPLLQRDDFFSLLDGLIRQGYKVTVETNGTQHIPYHWLKHSLVGWVIDFKLDQHKLMNIETIRAMPSNAFLKFVVANDNEFLFALRTIFDLRTLGCEAKMAFSPVQEQGNNDYEFASSLARWIITEGDKDFFINMQLHKILNVA